MSLTNATEAQTPRTANLPVLFGHSSVNWPQIGWRALRGESVGVLIGPLSSG